MCQVGRCLSFLGVSALFRELGDVAERTCKGKGGRRLWCLNTTFLDMEYLGYLQNHTY
jgi:hypothetical protein